MTAQNTSDEAIARKFCGTWRLVNVTRQDANTGENLDAGVKYDGYIAYTPDRRVTVIIARDEPGRERFITSYGAHWTLDGETIIHHVDIGSTPGRDGTHQRRDFRFHDDRLTLTPPISLDFVQKATKRSLEWQRVKAPA